MVASPAFAYDAELDQLPDSSLDTRNTRTDLVGDVLVRRKAKTLLVGVLCQAVINGDTDRLDDASVFIEKYLADPVPVSFAKIPDCDWFVIRHTRKKLRRGVDQDRALFLPSRLAPLRGE